MKRKFTYLLTALALLAFLSPTTAWGGVKVADTQRITQKTAHETMLGVPDEGGGTRENYQGTFAKITSVTDFVTGYYVVTPSQSASTTNKALGNAVDNNKRIAGVQVTISNNQIVNPDNTVVYYIEVSTSGETTTCTFLNVSTNKYMYQASTTSGKGMGFSDEVKNITLSGYNSNSPIGFKFTLDGASNNLFKWNNSSSWYANYSNDYTTSMTPVELFKLESSVPSTDPTISVNDNVIEVPSYIVGATEPEYETVTVNGSNLSADVVLALNANSDFEMSTDLETWSSSITLEQVNGSVTNEEVAVRLKAGLSQGTYNGTITLTSTDAEAVTVSLSGHVNNPTYAINLTQPAIGGTIAADKETAEAGETVTLTATPATGYAFGTWTVLDGEAEEVDVTNNQFIMPASDVEVEGSFVQQSYTITVAAATNGTVECDDQTAHYGEEIMVTVTPEEGYRVASFTVAETNGTATVTEIEVAEEIYSFTMPAYNVTITVVFEVIPEEYDGTGTFTKVTALTDLEDGGYYVLYGVNGNYKGAMNSSCTSGKMGLTEVTVNSNDEIVNPGTAIVWKLEKQTVESVDRYYLYNEAAAKYCYISSDGTSAFALSEQRQNYGYYTVSVDEGDYSFVGQYGGRMISIYQSDFRCYASSNAKSLYLYKLQAPSTDPIITVAQPTENVPATFAGESYSGTLALTYANLEISGMEDFGVKFYDAEGQELQAAPEGFEVLVAEEDPSVGEGYVVSYTVQPNTQTQERVARFKVYVGEVFSNLVTITQEAYVPTTTYTRVTSIESGRHYIIVNEGSSKAMGGQNSNNRAAVDVEIENGEATVSSTDVYEFVINGPDKDGFYTIYDASVPGYLYAVGGTNYNHLKTETYCQAHGQWTISFDQETNAASVVANITGRNIMRYNSTNNVFSCYASGQNDIYLYVKDNETEYTFYKDIAGYGTGTGKYCLLTSPIVGLNPAEVGMITDDNTNAENYSYDLYWFDQTQTEEWQNARQVESMSLVSGNLGYLYANKNNVTLHFTGTPNDVASVSLVKSDNDNVDWSGWNLVGNPLTVPAYIDRSFYRMNEDGTELMEGSGAINPMEGIFVIANANDEEMTFGTSAPTNVDPDVVVNVTNDDKVIDRAVVRFSQGSQLPKFQLNANSTKLYMLQGDKEMAIVSAQAEGEMPVSFRAAENGTYTLSVNPEGVEMNYLHLIDNMTGVDVDLLATPSYTFEAKTSDYASRFRLVFSANSVASEGACEPGFAYFNGSSWTVSNVGEATLQVVDVMGRVLSSHTLSGNAEVSINQPAGVYMLRLVSGDSVKVQKVVVR